MICLDTLKLWAGSRFLGPESACLDGWLDGWKLEEKQQQIPSNTLPETNIAPENRPSQNESIFQPSIFSCYVSFRAGNDGMMIYRTKTNKLNKLDLLPSKPVANEGLVQGSLPKMQ